MNFTKVINGNYFSATAPDKLEYHANSLLCINQQGYLEAIIWQNDPEYHRTLIDAEKRHILWRLDTNQYILPGFIDLHIHAPQWPNAGAALDLPLSEWLDTYTFPLEAKFKDAQFAQEVYSNLVTTLIANGTTTAVYFGSVDNIGNLTLARECQQIHQRGFIGKVIMDNPEQTPTYYRDESPAAAISATEQFIEALTQLNQDQSIQMTPVITPRFLPSCTPETLRGLGELVQHYHLPVQSHCSESDWEDGYALTTYGHRDAEVLDHFGLLTDKSIMAHGTLLTQSDLALFKKRGVAIAHCPISNNYFGNAILPAQKILAQGNKIGMGTDISGGFSPSIYQNIQQAVMAGRVLHHGVNGQLSPEQRGTATPALTARNAFYMATVGGAQSLQLKTGQIKPGYLADLQIVHSAYPTFLDESSDTIFEKLMYQTSAHEIDAVLTQGIIAKGPQTTTSDQS